MRKSFACAAAKGHDIMTGSCLLHHGKGHSERGKAMRIGWPIPNVIELLWHDLRTWKVEKKTIPAPFNGNIDEDASTCLMRLLLEAGIALSPSKSVFSPGAWFATVRYAEAFAPRTTQLRLVRTCSDWDSRLLAVLAEELGVGVAMFHMRTHFGVRHVADVEPLIQKGEVGFVQPPIDPDHAKQRPDFLGLTAANEAVFFEAKGTVGTRSSVDPQLQKGKAQVRNVRSLRHLHRQTGGKGLADRIVVGTHFCVEGRHKRSNTTAVLLDPPDRSQRPDSDQTGRPDEILRNSYAKFFNLAERPTLAARLLGGHPWNPSGALVQVETDGWNLVGVGQSPWGGILVLDSSLWHAFAEAGSRDLSSTVHSRLNEIEGIFQEQPHEGSNSSSIVMLNNGIGVWLPPLSTRFMENWPRGF